MGADAVATDDMLSSQRSLRLVLKQVVAMGTLAWMIALGCAGLAAVASAPSAALAGLWHLHACCLGD